MKKIKGTTQLLVYGLTVLSSAGMFLTIFAATLPTMPEAKQSSVSDFSQLHMQMGQTVFAAASPFPDKIDLTPIPGMETGASAQMLPPHSPVVPPMPGNPPGGGHDDVLRVIGILPPDVAILQRAGANSNSENRYSNALGNVKQRIESWRNCWWRLGSF